MSVATDSLLTLLEYGARVDLDTTDSNLDTTQIEKHIDAASAFIRNYCNRKFVTPSAVETELFSGDGTFRYFTKNRPIVTSTTPSLYYWDGDSYTEISSTTYPWTYDATKGTIYFTEGNKFWTPDVEDFPNWKLTYLYGWAQASIPEDLKQVVTFLVDRSLLLNKKAGLSTESFGDATTSYNLADLPNNTREVLNRYKVVSLGC